MKVVLLGTIAESLPCDYGDDPTDDMPTYDVVKVSNVSGDGNSMVLLRSADTATIKSQTCW